MRHCQSSRPRAGVESEDTGDGPCMLHFSSEHSKHVTSWGIVQPHGRSCELMEDQKGTMQSHGRSSDLIGNHVTKWMDHEAFQNS